MWRAWINDPPKGDDREIFKVMMHPDRYEVQGLWTGTSKCRHDADWWMEIPEIPREIPVKILRCPFCGGLPQLRKFENESVRYDVRCTDCSCQLPGYHSKSKAIEKWNGLGVDRNPKSD